MADNLGLLVAPLKIFQKSYIKSGNPYLKDFLILFCEILSVATYIESEVKMADNLGPMAWSFLPENEQVQYLQKIALRAENPSGPQSNSEKRRKDEKRRKMRNGASKNFLRSTFSAAIEAAHFPAVETGH
jgi:hypothetical protein